MSYPAPRYTGSTGEVNATYRPADHEPELTYKSGVKVHYLATGDSTHGLFGLYRWDFAPGRTGPDPHFHRSISESFFILAGSVKIYNGTEWIDTYPGDFVHVPEGGIHGFRNESGEAASMLLHFAPGAPREAYFEGLAHTADMTPEEKSIFYSAHDNIWL